MKYAMLAADTKRAVIEDEARKHGFELDRADLRSNVFFIRRGTEVRRGWLWSSIGPEQLAGCVRDAIAMGTRMETVEGSKYFLREA